MWDFSLILPTRGRVAGLERTLVSICETAACPGRVEVVLYIDEDDTESQAFRFGDLSVKRVIGPRCWMGTMTRRCYAESRGRCMMLANDDIVFRTPEWDLHVKDALRRYADEIALVWPNDLFTGLPAHPFLTRITCEFLNGISPDSYQRIFIDTHIHDVFRKLHDLGEDRLCYLPQVIVEHAHADLGLAPGDDTAVKVHTAFDERTYLLWERERQRIAKRMQRGILARRDGETSQGRHAA